MVAVGSPYSVLPKGFSKGFGDAAPFLAPGLYLARAAVRTGESSDDLKSWLLERLYLLIYRLGSSLRPPSASALRNSAALTSTSNSTVVLHYPCGPAQPRARRLCASSVPAHRPTLRFSRDILVPTTGVRESCSLSGALPSSGSCAPRPEQLQVYRLSNFRARCSRCVTWGTYPLRRAICGLYPLGKLSTRKPLGHLPSPEDGPRTPTGQSLASENAPFGAVLRAAPRYSRSLTTAGRSILCSA